MAKSRKPMLPLLLTGLVVAPLVTGCQTLREISALRQVDFSLDRASRMTLAGVDMSGVRSYDDLSFTDLGRITSALLSGSMPLEFDLHVAAEHPPQNTVQARLVQMDWTLLLQDRETISGRLDREVVLPPGEPRDIPLTMRLDLVDFVEGSAQDLVELALAIAGDDRGQPKEIALRARPTVQTSLGPIHYPGEITIVSQTVGS